MDSGEGTPPGVNSYGGIHHDQEHPLHSPSSGRKRKLQLEQLALPMSKHKSRHHLDPDESSGDNMDESETAQGLHLGYDQTDGSSSSGSSSSSSTMGDLKDCAEMSPKIFVPRFESSASPGNPPQGSDGLYSLDSRVVIKNSKNLSCQIPALDANHGVGEPDVDDEDEDEFIEEERPYATAQELMLSCCEDVGLHTLGLSSAKWNAKQDALPGTKRPTIDREFEEWFSLLMF